MKYIHYTNSTIKTIAERISETVSVRTYTNGNSRDERREATSEEQQQVFAVVFGALANLNYHIFGIGHNYGKSRDSEIRAMMQTVRDTAEFTINELVKLDEGEEINGYDSVYCPIWAMSEMLWNEESDFTNRHMQMFGISEEDIIKDDEAKVA